MHAGTQIATEEISGRERGGNTASVPLSASGMKVENVGSEGGGVGLVK